MDTKNLNPKIIDFSFFWGGGEGGEQGRCLSVCWQGSGSNYLIIFISDTLILISFNFHQDIPLGYLV